MYDLTLHVTVLQCASIICFFLSHFVVLLHLSYRPKSYVMRTDDWDEVSSIY